LGIVPKFQGKNKLWTKNNVVLGLRLSGINKIIYYFLHEGALNRR